VASLTKINTDTSETTERFSEEAVGVCLTWSAGKKTLAVTLGFPFKSQGWGYLAKYNVGRLRPEGPTPYPFIYHFGRKGTPFVYLLFSKIYRNRKF